MTTDYERPRLDCDYMIEHAPATGAALIDAAVALDAAWQRVRAAEAKATNNDDLDLTWGLTFAGDAEAAEFTAAVDAHRAALQAYADQMVAAARQMVAAGLI